MIQKTLTERQMKILTTLSRLEILTRSQLQSLFDLKGDRNARYTMQSLRKFTNKIFVGENAYYLNKRGIELVGADKKYRHSDQLMHKLMRNDAYIFYKPTEWFTEQAIE